MTTPGPARLIGRYLLFGEIASGGMATVHFGRLSGVAGFSRTVAIKRLHEQYAQDPEFLAMFLDEARLAARIRHPNVVPTLDVIAEEGAGEVLLVLEYVQGESLSKLLRSVRGMMTSTDTRVITTIMAGVLHGLHAAHEAVSEQGEPLNIVHRDVSPQNIMVGADGVARLLDFGVARAVGRLQTTRQGQLKGKIAYMSPEQLHNLRVTRQSDIYAAAVVTWEALTGQRLFTGDNQAALATAVLQQRVRPPSQVAPHVPLSLDRVVMRGLERDPARRYASAREMALDMERSAGVAPASEIGTWVESLARDELSRRATQNRGDRERLVVVVGELAANARGAGRHANRRHVEPDGRDGAAPAGFADGRIEHRGEAPHHREPAARFGQAIDPLGHGGGRRISRDPRVPASEGRGHPRSPVRLAVPRTQRRKRGKPCAPTRGNDAAVPELPATRTPIIRPRPRRHPRRRLARGPHRRPHLPSRPPTPPLPFENHRGFPPRHRRRHHHRHRRPTPCWGRGPNRQTWDDLRSPLHCR